MNNTKTLATVIGLCLAAWTAQSQLLLQPLTTFGTNGDGTVRPGDVSFLTADGLQRGMAYNPTTGHLIVVNRSPSGQENIQIVDPDTGLSLGELNQDALTFGGASGFPYNLVAVAEDGAIFVGNLTTSSTIVQYILYRWENESALQTRVYGPNNPLGTVLGSSRWGDTLAARGSGINTEVLICNRGNAAVIFKPTGSDMSSFAPFVLNTDAPGNAFGYALSFGVGNTFYAKAASADGNPPLFLLSYDTTAGTATVLRNYENQFPGRAGVITVDPDTKRLAAIEATAGNAPDMVRLYDVSDTSVPPVFLHRYPVSVWTNASGLFAGGIAFSTNNNVYALNTENGMAAFSIVPGTEDLAPSIFASPAGQIVQVTSNAVMKVGADGSQPMSYQWQYRATAVDAFADISGADSNILSYASAARGNQGDYRVIVTNLFGAATSSVATLTVLENYGNLLVYEPFNYPVGVSFLGQGGWIRGSGSTGGDFMPEAGSLTVPYMSESIGNHIVISGNGSPRKPIGSYNKGVLYFSCYLRLENITLSGTLPSNETTLGFANGTSTTYPLKFNIGCDDPTLQNYHIGLYKGGGTGNGAVITNLNGTTMYFTKEDTVFIVARYQFNPGTADDTLAVWINPDPSTFGAQNAPPPTMGNVGIGATDATVLDHFVLRRSGGFDRRHVDEVRVGFAWAEVTPPMKPSLQFSISNGNLKLKWPAVISNGYSLFSVGDLGDTEWELVTTPVVEESGTNTVTVAATGRKFFRLQK